MKLSCAFSRRGFGLAAAAPLVALAMAIPVGAQAVAAPRGRDHVEPEWVRRLFE